MNKSKIIWIHLIFTEYKYSLKKNTNHTDHTDKKYQ